MTATITKESQVAPSAPTQAELLAEVSRRAAIMSDAAAALDRLTGQRRAAEASHHEALAKLTTTAEAGARQQLRRQRDDAAEQSAVVPILARPLQGQLRQAMLDFLEALHPLKLVSTEEAMDFHAACREARDAAQRAMDDADQWVAAWGSINPGIAHQVKGTNPDLPQTLDPLRGEVFSLIGRVAEAEARRPAPVSGS